ncbi:molybdate ABC transporter substrate-binding protein [Halarcobacter bivalviorum]|uniref:molybdate ABC transporter substrate-binding protein n=1 Tax=Halarcobacter bivalviorum TaxID=663364 RepID=UPI00100B09B4|nr:molybdate ABC transporter substrate-binding protein [Halarcobacter bivalviorum]RXK04702.1 molybdate ABC transporter substrate-binding protein [Halarcobacter bivalviorum]
MKKIVFIVCALSLFLNAQNLKVAAGAGYKKPLMEILTNYEKKDKKIDAFFGNMKQVTAQAKQTDISLIIGDRNFLEKKSALVFKKFYNLGKGKLVIAYSKNTKLENIEQLKESKIKKISIPQSKKAIYGIAGEEFLKNSKLYEEVKNRLYTVATVPHSMTYIITNEVDAGIVNLTAALANRDKIGGFFEVPQKYYSEINIVAGELESCKTKKCKEFLAYLLSDEAKEVFKKYGL